MVSPINLQPIVFLRSVAHSNGNEARRITLPADWVRANAYPKNVFLVKGSNIIVITGEADKDLAIEAARCLYEYGFMQVLKEE